MGVVEVADQLSDGDQGLVVETVCRSVALAGDVGEDLAGGIVDAQCSGCSGEADTLQMREEGMDRRAHGFIGRCTVQPTRTGRASWPPASGTSP